MRKGVKDFNCVADKNDPDIDIIFAGSFIDEKDKEYIISKKYYNIHPRTFKTAQNIQ